LGGQSNDASVQSSSAAASVVQDQTRCTAAHAEGCSMVELGGGVIKDYRFVRKVVGVQFEWDDEKNEVNIRKHGIDFADVHIMFHAPMLVDIDDRHVYGEERWIGIGPFYMIIAVIVYTERGDDTIRIISARKATKYEQQRYEQAYPY
jgi:uncharacterized protein